MAVVKDRFDRALRLTYQTPIARPHQDRERGEPVARVIVRRFPDRVDHLLVRVHVARVHVTFGGKVRCRFEVRCATAQRRRRRGDRLGDERHVQHARDLHRRELLENERDRFGRECRRHDRRALKLADARFVSAAHFDGEVVVNGNVSRRRHQRHLEARETRIDERDNVGHGALGAGDVAHLTGS